MGEAQGKLRPEHQAELEKYRASGLAKRLPSAPPAGGQAQSGGGTLETSAARDKARSALATIDKLQPQLDRVRALQKSVLGRRGLAGLAEYNPLSGGNQQYDSAVAQLTSVTRPATRTPGEGSMSDFESKLATATLPNRWKRDEYNNEAIDGLQRLIDTNRTLYSQQLGLPAPPPRGSKDPGAALRQKYGLK
ncbi:hypothetical protein SR41_04620 [Sphingomonas melonis]|uniref:Uncharacterized protein n=1 Tax=Sphingomonas melonis TaxID=152682 RepID=A0A0D1MFW0_9SPHN|nr:hypothetical protein SR41_04620 [Sphingomonas melonis]